MRNIFTAFICFLFITPVFAQIKMGIKVSPQLTWTNTDSKSITTGSSHINISYGLVIDYHINENYSFGTEFSIGTFGGSIKPDSVYISNKSAAAKDLEYTYKLQYINVPLIIKMRTKEIGYIRYYAEFGLGMSYNFKAKADISSPSASVDLKNVDVNSPDPKDKLTVQNDGELSQGVNFFRSSIIIGAGIQYNAFGNTLLVAGLRYDNALNDFTDEERWKSSMNFLALHLGVMF
jgi:hypothetical protein